jgi:hypothetical protein
MALPPELVVPPDSREVSSRAEKGVAAVKFEFLAPFPATEYLASGAKKIEPRGWKPSATDWLNPGIPSSHIRGWTYFVDARVTPHSGIHQWIAHWQNTSGDVVSYALRYSSPVQDELHAMAQPTSDQLEVTAMLIPAETARAMQAQATQESKR